VDPQRTPSAGGSGGCLINRDGVSQGNRQWRDQTIRAGTADG
jgi:hypothetical protein